MEIKDYKQFLADGGEIRHYDGSYVTEAHQWADGKWAFRYSDAVSIKDLDVSEIEEKHTFRAPRERVKTWHCWDDYGRVSGFPSADTPRPFIGYTITEKQEDGSWKIIETTLKPNI